MLNKLLTCFSLTLALTVATPAFAGTVAWEWSGAVTEFHNGLDYTYGSVFVPTGNLIVSDLGYFNPTAGMTDSHWVGLYDSEGNLLAQTTVNSNSTLNGHFLFNSIVPVTLTSGNQYVIDAVGGTVDDYAYNANGFFTDANVAWAAHNWVSNGGQNFTGTSDTPDDLINNGFFGGNFIYGGEGITGGGSAPEPASFVLFGTGLLVAGLIRRRRS